MFLTEIFITYLGVLFRISFINNQFYILIGYYNGDPFYL